LKNAVSYGYEVEVLSAYNFKSKGYIFESYIKPIYEVKVNAKTSAEKSISKLLLNSLYGMMGFRGDSKVEMANIKDGSLQKSIIEHGEGHKQELSINVAIAAAITAYARVYMCAHRLRSVYTDTDSVVLHGEVESQMVSNVEIGRFKHEYTIKKAVFPAAKTYGFVTANGDVKVVTAGIEKGLVTFSDLFKAINGDIEARNKVYKYKTFRALIEDGSLMVEKVTVKRRTATLADARARIIHKDKDTGVVTWIGTAA
jgi:hypothetical protein